MKKLFCLIVIGLLILSITGCKNKQTDFAYYDSKTEEFYILDIPVSKGAGYFINEILKDSSWVLTTVEIPDDWSYSYFSNYIRPHWVTFNRKESTVKDSTLYYLPNYLFIEWYQSGQIDHISVGYNGCDDDHCEYYLKRFHTWDSIFPNKKIANKNYGYFEFFGIKNIKVYCTPNIEQYSFDEITNEKYEVNIRDVEKTLKELTPELTPEFDTLEDELIIELF